MDNDVNNLMASYTVAQRVKAIILTPFVFAAMYGQMVCAGANCLFDGIAHAVGNWIQK